MSQTGDLWVLGRHRILCGDSTVATDVERVLGGVEPHLMVTDPPYGVNYDPAWRNKAGKSINGTTQRVATGRVINRIDSRCRQGIEPALLHPDQIIGRQIVAEPVPLLHDRPQLKLGGFDLSLTGFGDLELKDLLAERTGGLTDPDDAPAAPEHPSSQ